MGETRDETVAKLRKRLGREPTKEEIDAAYESVIRRAYADMAMTAACFLDEADLDFGAGPSKAAPRDMTSPSSEIDLKPRDMTSSSSEIDLKPRDMTSSSFEIDLSFRPKGYFRQEKKVVIADIMMQSTLSDVIWVQAHQTKDRIRYQVIDEYGGEALTGKTVGSSKRPLTLGELADFFLGASDIFRILDMNFASDGYPLEEVRRFFSASSSFYPDFGKLVEQRVERWLQQQRSRLQSPDVLPE